MARPAGQLDRALSAVTIDLHQEAQHRNRMLSDGHTGEFAQQVQVDLSGVAGNEWDFADTQVNFEYPFLYAPIQRRVEFQAPHFSKGIEITSSVGADAASLLHLDAHVTGWVRSDEGWIVGAKVRFVVTAPNATQGVPYTAKAHLTFEGYASYPEGDEVSQ